MAIKQQRLSNGRVVWVIVGTDKWAATEAKAREIDARVHGESKQPSYYATQMAESGHAHERGVSTDVPDDFTWFDADGSLDENYEIAMAENGDYAYKIIGRVEPGRWADKPRHLYTIPPSFNPEASMIIVSTDGRGYNVGLYDEEDVSQHEIARGIPDVRDAIYLASVELHRARLPVNAARRYDARVAKLKQAYGTKRP